jgi:hypothetical protein
MGQQNLPVSLNTSEVEKADLDECNRQLEEHQKLMKAHPHLLVPPEERLFLPVQLPKPFPNVLMETDDGRYFMRTVTANILHIQGNNDNGKILVVDALIKVLKSETVNHEALLQWLEHYGQKQLNLLFRDKSCVCKNTCEILRKISEKWELSKLHTDKLKVIVRGIKDLFDNRKYLSMEETSKLQKREIKLIGKRDYAAGVVSKQNQNESLEILRKRVIDGKGTKRSLEEEGQHSASDSDANNEKKKIKNAKTIDYRNEDIERMIINVLVANNGTEEVKDHHQLVPLICETIFRCIEASNAIKGTNAKTSIGTWNRDGECRSCKEELWKPNFNSVCYDCIEKTNQHHQQRFFLSSATSHIGASIGNSTTTNMPKQTDLSCVGKENQNVEETEKTQIQSVHSNTKTDSINNSSDLKKPKVDANQPAPEIDSSKRNDQEKEASEKIRKEAQDLLDKIAKEQISSPDEIKNSAICNLDSMVDENNIQLNQLQQLQNPGQDEERKIKAHKSHVKQLSKMKKTLNGVPTRSNTFTHALGKSWEKVAAWHHKLVAELANLNIERQLGVLKEMLKELNNIQFVK